MPIKKAISYIEQNLGEQITLDDIAEKSGLSSYYFSRLFRSTTGKTTMGYLRHRRLTEAAKILEKDDTARLIHLALDYGFDSQEAFTRAFKKYFGFPPGQYRAKAFSMRGKYQLPLSYPSVQNSGAFHMEPNIVRKKKFNVIGHSDEFGQDNKKSIVDLWKKVGCRYHEIQNATGPAYGLCLKGSPESFTYMAAFEVDNLSAPPSDMENLVIEDAEYAVFTFTVDDRSPIGDQFSKVYQGIWGNWLPNSDYAYADTPDFELYDDRFDGNSATGEVDIWIPVTKKTLSA